MHKPLRASIPLLVIVSMLAAALALPPMSAAAQSVAAPDLVDTCYDVPDSGFPDTGDAGVHATSVDCLAAYGLTQGTQAGTYEPAGTVRRWQMALFIGRLAAAADDQLDELSLPTPGPTSFTDVGDLSSEARDAISVLNQLGVARGVTRTRYAPFERVTRAQMASFINRLQGAIQQALGGDPDGFTTTQDFFTDDDGSTHEGNINGIASVGITTGVAPGTYAPSAFVTRAQMASFLVRHIGVNVNAGVLDSAFVKPADAPAQEGIADAFVAAVRDGDDPGAAAVSTGHALAVVDDAVGGAAVVAEDSRYIPLSGVLADEYDAARVDVVLLLDTDDERFVRCTVAVGLVRRCVEVSSLPPGGLVGEPIDFFWQDGDVLAVVGVAADDTLNVREVPGVGERIVAELPPLADDLVATGHTRTIPGFWTEVEAADTVGWVSARFIAYLGQTDDATAEVVADLGGIPTADSMEELGQTVAETQATSDPVSSIVLVQEPSTADVPDVVYDVVGLGDDSVRGLRLRVFGQPTNGGFSLMSVERTLLCDRGVTAGGLCV